MNTYTDTRYTRNDIENLYTIPAIKGAIMRIESGQHKVHTPELKTKLLNTLYAKLEKLEAYSQEKKHKDSGSRSINTSEARIARDIESYISEYVQANTVEICAVNVIAEVLKLVLLSNTLAPTHVHWLELKEKLDGILVSK